MVLEKFPEVKNGEHMYGITFDLDTNILEDSYDISRQTAYKLIEDALCALGYKHIQYSVYVLPNPVFSELVAVHKTIEALRCLEWFKPCCKQIIAFKLENWGDITQEI